MMVKPVIVSLSVDSDLRSSFRYCSDVIIIFSSQYSRIGRLFSEDFQPREYFFNLFGEVESLDALITETKFLERKIISKGHPGSYSRRRKPINREEL